MSNTNTDEYWMHNAMKSLFLSFSFQCARLFHVCAISRHCLASSIACWVALFFDSAPAPLAPITLLALPVALRCLVALPISDPTSDGVAGTVVAGLRLTWTPATAPLPVEARDGVGIWFWCLEHWWGANRPSHDGASWEASENFGCLRQPGSVSLPFTNCGAWSSADPEAHGPRCDTLVNCDCSSSSLADSPYVGQKKNTRSYIWDITSDGIHFLIQNAPHSYGRMSIDPWRRNPSRPANHTFWSIKLIGNNCTFRVRGTDMRIFIHIHTGWQPVGLLRKHSSCMSTRLRIWDSDGSLAK